MKKISMNKLLLPGLLIIMSGIQLFAQTTTIVKGVTYDSETGGPLPFCNISVPNSINGVISDVNGKFQLQFKETSDSILVSFVGYKSQFIKVKRGVTQHVNVQLKPELLNLDEIVVTAKRKIKNKHNPAIELMQKVRSAKDINQMSDLDFLEHEVYRKIEIGTKVTDKLLKRRIFKKIDFLEDYIDTLESTNDPVLPFYFYESISKKYHDGAGKDESEIELGTKINNIIDFLDENGIEQVTEKLYQPVNIYDATIHLFGKQFTGPLATIGNQFYYYQIKDTLIYENHQCVSLTFESRNASNFTFDGELLIDIDTSYAIVKADLIIPYGINLNFVKEGTITNEFRFDKNLGRWVMTKNTNFIVLGDEEKKSGLYGRQVLSMQNYHTEKRKSQNPLPKNQAPDKDSLWSTSRHEDLSAREAKIEEMIEKVHKTPTYKRASTIATTALGGYIPIGAFSFGSINSIYSYNDTEGPRIRLGGRTNEKFSQKLEFSGYGLYGMQDKKTKYSIAGRYSFSKLLDNYPRKEIRLGHQYTTIYPGFNMKVIDENNAFLAIKRGVNDKLLFIENYELEYLTETVNNWSFSLNLKKESQSPYGSLKLTQNINDTTQPIEKINFFESGITIRYAPHQTFFQGMNRRRPIKNEHPIYTLGYRCGIKGLLNGDYNYHHITLDIFKRSYFGAFGYGDLNVSSGKVFGKNLPFTLLNIPNANQTYFYSSHSYNMMNFLEFTSDQYVAFSYSHHFEGIIINQLPVLKKTGIRTRAGVKGLWGSTASYNDPNSTSHLPQFPTNKSGEISSFTLNSAPYLEGSIGLYNLFKLVRIDLVKRFTYLDNPNIPILFGHKGLGLRVSLKLEF